MGLRICELVAAPMPTGLPGSLCFGMERTEYVPFWCAVATLTFAYMAFLWLRERRNAPKVAKAVRPRRKDTTSFPKTKAMMKKLLGMPSKVGVEGSGLEAGLLEDGGDVAEETHICAREMAKVCAEKGASRGVEAASLAVLLALQRRRKYASVTARVVRQGVGSGQDIDVELALPKVSFADYLLEVNKALEALARSSAAASAETPELTFAWNQSLPDAPGQWLVRQVGRDRLAVLGTSVAEERCFQIFFEACAKEPETNMWDLPMAPEADIQSVKAWGMPAKDFANYRDVTNQRLLPVTKLLAGPFANPKADAVAGSGFCLSYEELFRRASIVKQHVLKAASDGAAKAAILFMPRGEAIAPAFIGTLQAGFTVVPVDVHWPGDRAACVAEDSDAAVVLVDSSSAQAWNALGLTIPTLCVDEKMLSTTTAHAMANGSDVALDQDDPAMMLFTSGSTGKPKGIVLSQGYVTSIAAGVAEWKRMQSHTRTLCYHSPTWMPFIDYLFAPLLKGGCCLYFPDGGSHVVQPSELKAFANEHGATNAGFVPAMLDIFMQDGLPKTMTDIGVGGAAVPADLCCRVLEAMPQDGILYTGYSGTEQGDVTAVQMRTRADIERVATERGHLGAGRPHAGQRCAILDEGFSPVAPGAVGEVNAAGPGLASGYLKLPEKTAETFLPSLPALGGARAARTGDLAVWTENGNLQVVGRRDAMVKVRGARVELGEVETAVLSHPDVKATVVTVYEDKLVAYVVPAIPSNLREHCKGRLVAYMVPHLFEGLEELPRLPNGKVNKKALPKPEAKSDGAETVMDVDSLGQMRKFTRKAASEDRVLDNVRAILIGVVIQSHATPLFATGSAMLQFPGRPLGADWGPIQMLLLHLVRGGGWSSLAFLNGFDDTRSMKPYGLTYREPLFLVLWVVLGFNWTMWYLPAFVLMRAAFCAAHHLGFERTSMLLCSQLWIVVPAFVDFYIGWKPQSPVIPEVCPSECFCPWKEWPHLQTVSYYTVGWWVDAMAPTRNSFVGHALIFIPCYWIGFYWGGSLFKLLTKVADETSYVKRALVAGGVLGLYCVMYSFGQSVTNDFDDRCSSFHSPDGFVYKQVFRNLTYYAMNLSMSLTYVIFIAAAVPVHLKYMAKICFSSLICSAFTPCILDLPTMALELRKVLPASISPGVEMAWVFSIPFLYELVVGAFFAVVLPIIAKAVIRAASALPRKA